jgi:MFS family permease
MAVEAITTPGADEDLYARPTARLPWLQLLQISIYWFGINSVWGAWEVLNQERVPVLFGQEMTGRAMIPIELAMALVAIAVQPTVGCISDYTITRWGRRKPYIIVGSILDVIFLYGLVTTNAPLLFVAFVLLLEFSSNFAQGPFQGYVPDLVPEEQVGTASALVGLMSMLGVIGGVLIVSQGIEGQDFTGYVMVVAFIELATAVGTFVFVREGRTAKPREGRTWRSIAREAWGTDILRERSYVWLLASRFFVLGAGGFVGNLSIIWMQRAMGMAEIDRETWVPLAVAAGAVGAVLATVPAAKVSDWVGRKPVIWVACAVGAIGTGVFAFAPEIEIAVVAGLLVGAGSGMFLAVDWALLSELVPKASSGRYMGMSQLATALQGVTALVFGGLVLDIVANGLLGLEPDFEGSARWAIGFGVLLYIVGALLLIPVREPQRRRTSSGLGALGGGG